ncbi:hypothetical protein [Streptomyces sp. NPDC020983]|uniref:hypothetical protein n=1 Tax=Streptomyces sp. NPDC020983 TaxID=3365106 RepID=UPI0037B83F7E
MSAPLRPRPGPPAGPADAARARERHRVLREELPRVRDAAAAWRNGLAGLLAALVGFGLVKGRTEIDKVAPPWHVVIGALLLLALLAGAAGGLYLLRAANGPPRLTPHPAGSPLTQDHTRAVAALADLRRGIAGALACAAFLVLAVGTTWYAPPRQPPQLRVQLPGSTLCGDSKGIARGTLTLHTTAGDVPVDLARILTVEPVEECP